MSKKLLLITALLLSSMNFAFAASEVNVNTATQAQLESIIPGDATTKRVDAELIIQLRNSGRFTSNEDFKARTKFKKRVTDQLTASGAVVR